MFLKKNIFAQGFLICMSGSELKHIPFLMYIVHAPAATYQFAAQITSHCCHPENVLPMSNWSISRLFVALIFAAFHFALDYLFRFRYTSSWSMV